MEHGSGGVTLEQLAARLAIAEDALAVALARLDAVDRDHAASRDERRQQHSALAHLGDLMLALGQRVGKVERAVDAQDELARLRHSEVMAALGVAARDTTAKGARIAATDARVTVTETTMARVMKGLGWSGTVMTLFYMLLQFLAQHVVWRLDRHARNPSNPAVAASASAASPVPRSVPGRPVDGEHHADP